MKLRWHLKSKVNTTECTAFRFGTLHKRKGDKEGHEGFVIQARTLDGNDELIELILTPDEVDRFVGKAELLKQRFADPAKLPPEFKED